MYHIKQEQPFNPGLPQGPGSLGQFSATPLGRMGPNKPPMPMVGMMPPPSPAQGGPPKAIKQEGGGNGGGLNPTGPNGQQQQQQQHNPDGSPSNAPPGAGGGGGGPSGGGTAPPTPVPGNRPNPQQPQQQQQQQQQNPNPMGGMMSSPSPLLNLPPTTNMGLGTDMFEFGNMVDDFENNFLVNNTTGDINFERDFGQWFNHPDDLTSGLDMK